MLQLNFRLNFFKTPLFLSTAVFAAEPKSLVKYKNWESFAYSDGKGKVCFAQTIPTERSPKNFKRDESRLFVTFRKEEKIKDEISVTSGHVYKQSSVVANSGKNKFSGLSKYFCKKKSDSSM